jgi:ribosomal protein S6--L-glutamate ligase
MILSFHPIYEGDVNILCAGRQPDDSDLAAIRKAEAVILPQGCMESLYRMAREENRPVFPNYDLRFRHPGKTGQARLFQTLGISHPQTWVFDSVAAFERYGQEALKTGFPLVLKFDWGGEGDTVFLIEKASDLQRALSKLKDHERTGQAGFVLQTFVSGAYRSLRVVVIGDYLKAYWRIQPDPMAFGTSVSKGARIDCDSDPALRREGRLFISDFCRQTKIDLAGCDVLFKKNGRKKPRPLLLEINYFFGRNGLGGSEAFYGILQEQIDRWLKELGLSIPRKKGAQK